MTRKKAVVGLSGAPSTLKRRKVKRGQRVAMGLSGGVDSAVSAALLVEAGYDVTGVFLECWRAPGCRVDEDRKDAMDVALNLKIPFKVLDFKQAYKDKVVEYFYREYKAGRTPNPDTMCNKEIKFGLFYDWAMENGFDFVATGHYARVGYADLGDGNSLDRKGITLKSGSEAIVSPDSLSGPYDRREFVPHDQLSGVNTDYALRTTHYELLRAVDSNKDQTYFLYLLREQQLEHILFPIGHLTKPQVREEAKKRGLAVAAKPDSVGICFIGDINVRKFLEERITPKKGEVVNPAGEVIGEHEGVWFYTIGQRHGFTISGTYKSKSGEWKHSIPPLYVIGKRVEKNQLIVGFGMEGMKNEFEVGGVHWINQELGAGSRESGIQVRIRHRGKLIHSMLKTENERLLVEMSEPQKGVASGQAVVFYQGEVCLGGGIIQD